MPQTSMRTFVHSSRKYRLQKVIADNPPVIKQLFPEVSVISVAGLDVSKSLEALAERLA
jgi:hypothetical protein